MMQSGVDRTVLERRPLLKNVRKRDRTEPCVTALLIGLGKENWPSITLEIARWKGNLSKSKQNPV